MSWLTKHIDTFVKPILGESIPNIGLSYFSSPEKTIIKNVWRSVKKEAMGRVIILPGRDTYIFEILARRENYPTLFIPQCSIDTVSHITIPLNSFLFDTGFRGTIPKTLNCKYFKLMAHTNCGVYQVFPHLNITRELVTKIENSPKYWERAIIKNGEIIQEINNKDKFKAAFQLTLEIYKDSSPSFVETI